MINFIIMKKIKVLLAAGAFLLTTGTITAQWGAGYGQGALDGGRFFMGIPDLTLEQRDQIRDLRSEHLNNIKPLRNDVRINNILLETLQTEDDPDMNEINELIEKNGKLLTEIRKKQAAHNMEIRNLLTDEQKVFFDDRIQRMGRNAEANYLGRGMGPGSGYGYGLGRAGYGRGYRYNQGYARAGWGRGYGRGQGYGWRNW